MNLDDEICYCYHVPLRKLVSFARREQPARASQMSECLGAGTGCGWCIPILQRIHDRVMSATVEGGDLPAGADATETVNAAADATISPADHATATIVEGLPTTAEEYAARRQEYIRTKQPRNQFE